MQAVYKPHQGEQSLWDFPDGLYRREVAAYRLSEALGWGIVPPTVLRKDAPFGPGSLQLFVEADYEQHYFTLLEEGGREDELRVFCAFDVVANNADRKSGHVLVGRRRAPVGHRPRPVLPRPAQAAHGHLGLRRRGGARLDRRRPRAARGRRAARRRGGAAVRGPRPRRCWSGRPGWPTPASSPSRWATGRRTRGPWCERPAAGRTARRARRPAEARRPPASAPAGAAGPLDSCTCSCGLDGLGHRGGQAGPATRGSGGCRRASGR